MAQLALSLSFFISVILVILSRLQSRKRDDLRAVQACHVQPTSRYGGVAVAVGLCGALLVFPTAQSGLMLELILCALPVFVAGLAEDAGWRVPPVWRLAASVCSSLVAILVFETVITRLGVAPLDAVFAHRLPALLLTALVMSGVCQAFNLVDGLHGLCGFASLVTAGALALIGLKTGHDQAVQVLWVVMAAVGGFLMVNFPRGLLFLGDAGAYVIGLILACIAVEMLKQQPDLSPWAVVLVFFWPLADMVFAVARRTGKKRSSFGADRMHFHHVIMRSVAILVLGESNRPVSNPITSLILLPLMAAPATLGVLFWNRNGQAFALVLLMSIVFVLAYRGAVSAAKARSFGLIEREGAQSAASSSGRRRVRA